MAATINLTTQPRRNVREQHEEQAMEHTRTSHSGYEAGIIEDPDITGPSDMEVNGGSSQGTQYTRGLHSGVQERTTRGVDHCKRKEIHKCCSLIPGMQRLRSPPRRRTVSTLWRTGSLSLKSRSCRPAPPPSARRVLVRDREVQALRHQFVTFNYAQILYSGLLPWRASAWRRPSLPARRRLSMGRSGDAVYKVLVHGTGPQL
jgi:hypothetical protein